MRQVLIPILILLSLTAQSQRTGSFDPLIDAGIITHWRDNWSSRPISLSSSAQGETVTMTIQARFSERVPQTGSIEIVYPRSYDGTGGAWKISPSAMIPEDEETTLTLTVTLPNAAGAYGPFGIIARKVEDGQIICMTNAFGSIYVTGTEGTGSLGVNSSANQNQIGIGLSLPVTFTFQVDEDIWANDVFAVTLATGWTINSQPTCRSIVNNNDTNYLVSAAGNNELDCSHANGIVYVYGIAQDVDVNLLTGDVINVSIEVTGITAPEYVTSPGDNAWVVTHWEVRSSEKLTAWNGTGIASTPGTISSFTWGTNTDFDSSNIAAGLTMYINFEFTTEHTVPANGEFIVDFSSADLTNPLWRFDTNQAADNANIPGESNYCYVHPSENYSLSCSLPASGQLNLGVGDTEVTAGTVISFSLLVNFTGTTSCSGNVTSRHSNGKNIDVSQALVISYNSDVSLLTSSAITFNDDTIDPNNTSHNANTTGSSSDYYIRLTLSNFSNLQATNVRLYIPSEQRSGPSDFKLQLTESVLVTYTRGAAPPIPGQTVTQATDSLTTIINLDGFTSTSLNYYNADENSSHTNMYLPRVESNLATRYESYITFTQESQPIWIATRQFGFVADTFDIFDITQECRNMRYINVLPKFVLSTQSSYQIEFKFTGFSDNLGSGLDAGDAYPVSFINSTGGSLTLSDSSTLTLSGFTEWQSSTGNNFTPVDNLQFFTAYENGGAGRAIQVLLYYELQDMKYIVTRYEFSQTSDFTLGDHKLNKTPTTLTIEGQNSFSSNKEDFIASSTSPETYTLQFPQGFNLSEATFALANSDAGETATAPTSIHRLNDSNLQFNYPAIIGYQGHCSDANCEITVSGVTNPRNSQVNATFYYGAGNSCQSDTPNSIVTGDILVANSSSQLTIESSGADNYHQDISFTINPDHKVPVGGLVQFNLGLAWNICDVTTCQISGGGVDQSCTINGSTTLEQEFDGTSMTVTIEQIMPPANTSQANQTQTLVRSVTTRYDNRDIDLHGNTTEATITTLPQVGQSSVQELWSFPDFSLATSADFYMRFTLNKDIPANSEIRLIPPTSVSYLATTNFNDKLFFSKVYRDIVAGSNLISFVTTEAISSGEVLELYIEDAFNNPEVTTENGFGIQVRRYCSGIAAIIINDYDTSITLNDTNKLNILTQSVPSLNTTQVISSEQVAGRTTNIEVAFTITQQLLTTDTIYIKFPREFDEMIANEIWPANYNQKRYLSQDIETYFVSCSSPDLGDNLECSAQHRWVKLFNLQQLEEGEQISVLIQNVQNPQATQTNITASNFKVYHISEDGAFKGVDQEIVGLTISDIPNSTIDIKRITADRNAFTTSNYTFAFYLDSLDLRTSVTLNIVLPRQYYTDLARGLLTDLNNEEFSGVTVGCSLRFFDTSDDISDVNNPDNAGTVIEELDNCALSNNTIFVDFSATTAQTFDSKHELQLTVEGINNPEWGLMRSNTSDPTGSYDAWNQDAFPQYDFWTNQFEMSLQNNVSNTIVSASYQNLHGAWLGFNKKARGMEVNGFDPINRDDYIQVYTGTQTKDITVQTTNGITQALGADKIVFTPSLNTFHISNGSLSFSSVYNAFTMYDTDSSFKFRVSASTGTDQGIYYINWALDETRLDTSNEDAFDPPVKTLVEVIDTQGQVDISVSPNTSMRVVVGQTSIPIRVSTQYAPYENLIIRLNLNTESNLNLIKFSQASLNFVPDRNQRYFTIKVDDSYDLVNNPTQLEIIFTLEGENAASYRNIPNLVFTIAAEELDQGVLAPTFSDAVTQTQTSANLSIETQQAGILYTQCSPKGETPMSGTYLKYSVYDYYKIDEQTTSTDLSARGEQEVKPLETDQNSYTDNWAAFQYRLYKDHLNNFLQLNTMTSDGNQSIYSITVNNLYAETDYQCWAYLENEYKNMSDVATITFATLSLSPAVRFSITFAGDVPSQNLSELKDFAAVTMYTQPTRFINAITTQETDSENVVTQTLFQWDIPAYRHTSASIPSNIADLTVEQESKITQFLVSKDISLTPPFSFGVIEQPNTPAWADSQAPALSQEATDTSATFNLACTSTGFVCGTCAYPQALIYPNHNQVLLGLDENNNPAFGHTCQSYSTANQQVSLQITGLNQDTEYNCYFQCFNTYPVWPGYVPYSQDSSNYIARVSIKTAEEEDDDDDSAKHIVAIMAGILALLIQLVLF